MNIDVIRRAQSGDSEALAQLYDGMYKRVYYLALRLTKNQEDAEDAAQETFISAFGALPGLTNPEAFESWLFQITSNKCRNILRKNSHTVELTEDEDGNTILDDMADPNEELIPESAMENEEQRRLIMETIQALPQNQRECVFLFYYSQLSVKQIAEDLGCSEGTVKSRLNYARQKIKESILHIEKRDGIRLHSFAPIGLLLFADFQAAAGGISIPALGAAGAAAGTAGAAGVAAAGSTAAGTTGAGAGAAATAAAGATGSAGSTAATVAGVALKTKIVAGVTAAAIAVGGGTAVILEITKEPVPAIEYVEFADANMEHNMHILLDIPEDEGIPVDAMEDIYHLYFVDDGMTFLSDEFIGNWVDENGNAIQTSAEGAVPNYHFNLFRAQEGTLPVSDFSDLQYMGNSTLNIACIRSQSPLTADALRAALPDAAIRSELIPEADLACYDIILDPEYVSFSDPNMENNMHVLLGIPQEDPITTYEMRNIHQISLSASGMNYFNGRHWHDGPYMNTNDVAGTLPVTNYEDFRYLGRHLVITVDDEDFVDEEAILKVRPDAEFHYPFREEDPAENTGDESIASFANQNMEHNIRLLLDIPAERPVYQSDVAAIIELFFFHDGMNLTLESPDYKQTEVHDLPSVTAAEGTLPVTNFQDLSQLGSSVLILGIMDAGVPLDESQIADIFPGSYMDVQDHGEGKYVFIIK